MTLSAVVERSEASGARACDARAVLASKYDIAVADRPKIAVGCR